MLCYILYYVILYYIVAYPYSGSELLKYKNNLGITKGLSLVQI